MIPKNQALAENSQEVASIKNFCNRLQQSGLMDGDTIRGLWSSFGAQTPKNVDELANELLRRNKLTNYQYECLKSGRTQGLKFDQYTILDHIGDGGMGQVFKARHERMQRDVALKIISPKFLNSAETLERFEQEARAAAKLSHPNIVAAYDAGEKDGTHYLVLEYVDGQDLATVVDQRGPLRVPIALDFIMQAAEGLQYSHRKGIVHRDIKPANLLVDSTGVVKILDMGLAFSSTANESAETSQHRLTQQGQVMGTSAFMAPEQALDVRKADARSDIYALGCTLYNLLVGHPPYSGETNMAVIVAHREEPIPSLTAGRPEVPASVDNIFRKMVAKKPQDRFASMGEVIAAIRSCSVGAGLPAEVQAVGMASSPLAKPCDVNGDTFRIVVAKQDTVITKSSKSTLSIANVATWMAVATLSLAAIGALGVMLSVKTSQGTLVVESDDPDIKIAVKQNGELVEIIDAKDQWKVSLKEGKYELELTGGNDKLTLERNVVVVRNKQTERLRATLQPPTAAKSVATPDPEAKKSPVRPPVDVAKPSKEPQPVVNRPISPATNPRTENVPVLRTVRELAGRNEEPSDIAFSPDGKVLVSTSRSGHVVMWDVASGKFLRQFQLTIGVQALVFSPDGKSLAFVGENAGAILVETETGKIIHKLTRITDKEVQESVEKQQLYPAMTCAAFSPDGTKLVTASNLNDTFVWDVATGKQLAKLQSQSSAVYGVAFAPNGRRFATASHDGTTQLWNADSHDKLKLLRHKNESTVFDLFFTADSSTLYTCGNATDVVAWDPETGNEIVALPGHGGPIIGISISADGKLLLSNSPSDRSLRFWDVAQGKLLSVLRNAPLQPMRARFSPTDPTLLAIASEETVVRLFRYTGEEAGEVGNERKLADGTVILHQEVADDYLVMPPWQSFKSPTNGTLVRVDLQPIAADGDKGELAVYEGEGINGKQLHTQPFSIERNEAGAWRAFTLSAPLTLEKGKTYTVELGGVAAMHHSNTDRYGDGRASGGGADMVFRLYVKPGNAK